MFLNRIAPAVAAIALMSAVTLAQGAKPTDPQIAHIAYTAGVLDITAAQQALKKTQNAEVRGFAEGMIKDHETVNKLALDLVAKLKVTPEDNPTAQSLKTGGEKNVANLKTLSGAAFDKAYIDHEVEYHQAVLDAVDKTLIPSAKNAELKALLQKGLKIFQGHEKHAESVVAKLK